MNYEMMDPRDIRECPWNSNVVSPENEEKIRASITRLGMFKPLLVRELPMLKLSKPPKPVYECIGGWHRCEQAIVLGMETVPVINLGSMPDERAKEISLADNARYGIDDSFRLSELIADLDRGALEAVLPWSDRDIASITSSLAVEIDNLDIDSVIQPDPEDEGEPEEPKQRIAKTHTIIRARVPIETGARISRVLSDVMRQEGFTQEDDLTNAGDALAFVVLGGGDDAE